MTTQPQRATDIPRKFGPISVWCQMTGMSRRVTYQWLAEGKLRAFKAGARTVLDIEHGLSVIRSLPVATFTSSRRASRPASDVSGGAA